MGTCDARAMSDFMKTPAPSMERWVGGWRKTYCADSWSRAVSSKRTSKERMAAFDNAAIMIINNLDYRREPFVVHDMAVSDGRTACDFFLRLSVDLDDSIEFYSTDACRKVIAVREPGRRTTVVVDDKNNVLRLMRLPFVLPMRAIE